MAEAAKQETTSTTGQQTERTFTQAEMNAILEDRLAQERGRYADYERVKKSVPSRSSI